MKFMNETARSWNMMRRIHSGITYGSIQMNGQKSVQETITDKRVSR